MNLSVQIGLYLEPDYKMTKIMREKLQSIEKYAPLCASALEGGGESLPENAFIEFSKFQL
jgi:hypothetical protein